MLTEEQKSDKPKEAYDPTGRTLAKTPIMEEAFANAYVRFGFNGTRAIKSIRTDITDESARVLASQYLARDNVAKRVMDLLPKQSKAKALIYEALRSERPKNISWRDLHKYVVTDLELRGELKQAEQRVNVGIIIEDNG